jgi:hypothetical protein
MIPVEGYKGLFRDEKSNAIINRNDTEYNEYLKLKNTIIDEKNQIDILKKEISEIKLLLKDILSNK